MPMVSGPCEVLELLELLGPCELLDPADEQAEMVSAAIDAAAARYLMDR